MCVWGTLLHEVGMYVCTFISMVTHSLQRRCMGCWWVVD